MNPKAIAKSPPDQGGLYQSPMPGVGDLRVPHRRFFDAKGRWGYLIENCRVDRAGLHVLYNWVKFPDCFEGKDSGGTGIHDMGILMERNHEDNLQWLQEHGIRQYPDWKNLWGKYEGETLVIASCGPSLSESLPTLYRRRKDFRLMCLNRSYRAFNHPEYKPDIYYFVERRALPDWFMDLGPQGQPLAKFDTEGVTMIGTPQCDPRAVKMFDPKNCYFGFTCLGALGHLAEINRLTRYDLKAATTIGNTPYIAQHLGFKKVIYVGCDFSLDCELRQDPNNAEERVIAPTRMYFDKMWNQTHYAKNEGWIQGTLPVLGINNRCVMVDPLLSGHRDYMECLMDILHFEAGVKTYNCSPRGCLMFNVRDLEEALDE